MLKMVNDIKDDSRWYPFRVTVGLIEGYQADAKRHNLNDVKRIVGDWLRACKANNLPELPGMVSEKTMLYTRRSDGELLEEPVVIFEGEVNALRIPADITEERFLSSLWGLAALLVANLHQSRIYVKFNHRTIVLEDQ